MQLAKLHRLPSYATVRDPLDLAIVLVASTVDPFFEAPNLPRHVPGIVTRPSYCKPDAVLS